MKKNILLLILLSTSLGFSQTVLEDFEGTAPTVRIENDPSGSVTISLDPEAGGTHGNVMKLVTSTAAESWVQAELFMQTGQIDLTAVTTNREVTVDIYSTTPRTFMAKVVEGSGPDSAGNSLAAHTGNGWETITFSFETVGVDNTAAADGVYAKIFFFPFRDTASNGWNSSEEGEFYFDNITAVGGEIVESCAGTSSDAQQGTFPAGYTYGFETLDTGAVRLTFALPAGTDGVVAYAWKETPFSETPMTVSGAVATIEIEGYTAGAAISYAVKFAWAAGGFGVTKYFSYTVGEDCSSTEDSIAPSDFIATVGTVGAFSVELLLNATDEGSDITYNILYGENGTAQTAGASDTTTSLIISGLAPETAYSFVVTASDASGNANASPITLAIATMEDSSTDCEGQTADYAYTFETLTNGTEVKVTMELLETVSGLVAQFFNDGSGNQNPVLVSGQKYEYTFTGLTSGIEISFTAGFAWSAGGGLQIARTYTVGNDCATASISENNLLNVSLYPSPAKNELTISAENTLESICIYNVLGRKVQSFEVNTTSKNLDISSLSTGIYILKYTANNIVGSMKFIKE